MNQKAQVSLEYILLTLSVVVVLSLIIVQVSILYTKNLKAIEQKELKTFYEKLQASIDVSESLENYTQEMYIKPQKEWSLKKNKENYVLSNQTQSYEIKSYTSIQINFTSLKKGKVIFKKENKKISLKNEP